MKKFTLVFLLAIIVLGGVAMFLVNSEVSLSERRKLTQWSQVLESSVTDGSFMEKAEDASMDQFPLRDFFRSLKANFVYKVMGQLDNNNIIVDQGSASQLDYPLSEQSVNNAISKIQNIQKTYLLGKPCKVYYSWVPDKNYYLAQEKGYPTMDYEKLTQMLAEAFPNWTALDLTEQLTLDSYYATDPHWTQGKILSVAQYLAESMGATFQLEGVSLQTNGTLTGAYAGQSAMNLKSDDLTYYDGGVLENCIVTDLATGKRISMYDFEGAQGNDPYDFFLHGMMPLMTIQNPNNTSGKELILFRDSFGSSIAPLMVGSYSKITLVDLRYIHPNMLGNYIQFRNQDVLFMYSCVLLNQSSTLQ